MVHPLGRHARHPSRPRPQARAAPRRTHAEGRPSRRHPRRHGRPSARSATVQGWIRTRRDSKAGLSFLAVHDGSCFDALQVVAPATLANYADEVLHLTAGCAVTVSGTVAASQGKGQAVELLADSVEVVGWVDDPDTYPISPKRHTFEYLREVAHLRPRTNTFGAVARVRHSPGHGDPPLLRRARLLLDPHADPHRQRRRGRRRAVPRLDPRPRQPPADARRRGRLRPGLLRQARLPHRLRPAQRRDVLPGAHQRLHVRAHVPGRELQHQPAPVRVLDGRAGDRVRRRRATTPTWPRTCSSPASARSSTSAPTTWRSSPSASTRRPSRRLEGLVNSSFARMEYTEAIEVLERAGRVVGVPGRAGASPSRPSTSATCARSTRSGRWWSSTTRRRSRRSTCASTTTGARWRRWTCSRPGIGEIVGGSQREERLDVLDARIRETGLDPSRRTGGTATCAGTAPCRTPGSGSGSTGRSRTPPAWPTSATSSRSRARRRSADF